MGVTAYLLLQPTVQTWAAKKAADYLTKELNTTVKIDSLGITNLNTLYLAGLLIKDKQQDTLLYAGTLRTSLGLLSVNNQRLNLRSAQLTNAVVNLSQNAKTGIYNYEFIANYFSPPSATPSSDAAPWFINIKNLDIKNTRFSYHDYKYTPTTDPTIDFSHIVVKKLNFLAQNINIGYNYQADIKHLSLQEQKGFILDSLATNLALTNQFISLKKLQLKTPNTYINGDIALKYASYTDLIDKFETNTYFDANINRSLISPKDIAFFATEINILKQNTALSGKITGSIDNLKGTNLNLSAGENIRFLGNIAFEKLITNPFEKTHIVLDVKDASFSKSGIEAIINGLYLPKEIDVLGLVNFSGKFDGFPTNFKASGSFNTAIGDLKTDLKLYLNGKKTTYDAYILTQKFDVGKLINDPNIGKISIDGTIKGVGNALENAIANVQGSVTAANINGYEYKNAQLNGKISNSLFVGKFTSNDPNLSLNFDGLVDFKNPDKPIFDFVSNIKRIDLFQLKLTDEPTTLSGDLSFGFSGSTLDDFSGTAKLKNIVFAGTGKELKSQYIDFQALNTDTGKVIMLRSDIADANVSGDFTFKNIADAFETYLVGYLPSYKPKVANTGRQAFKFDIDVKNGQAITDFLYPNTYKFSPILAKGSFDNTQNGLDLDLKMDFFETQGYKVKNVSLLSYSNLDGLFFKLALDDLSQNDSILVSEFRSENALHNDSVEFSIIAKGEQSANQARIKGIVNLLGSQREISFNKGRIVLSGKNWDIEKQSRIVIDSLGGVNFKKFAINYANDTLNNQYIQILGRLSEQPTDVMRLLVNGFDLALLNPFIANNDVRLGGITKLNAQISGIFATPNVFVDLDISDFNFNDDAIGDVRLFSDWNEASQRVDVTGLVIKQRGIDTLALLAGNLKLNDKNMPFFDFDLSLNQSTISPLQTLLSPYLTNITGLATGGLRLYGTASKPLLTGFARINKGSIRVDYLNTTYGINTQINFNQNSIDFVNSELTDAVGGTGKISGGISHNYFDNIKLNLRIDARNLLVLNTAEVPDAYFFGKAKGTGYAAIKGGLDDLHFDVALSTEKGTAVSLPTSSSGYSRETSFINFVNPKDTIKKSEAVLANNSGVDFDIKLQIKPNAELTIIFDKIAGDKITAKGTGDIRLLVDKQSDISMNGGFTIDQGNYLFTFSELFNKNFSIQKGSTLTWAGDPFDAQINIDALYAVSATVPSEVQANLGGSYVRNVPVNCILKMKGSMLSPDIAFQIAQNNNGSGSISSPLQAYIARINSNEQELNEQMLSLMLASKFSNLNNILSDVGTTALQAGVGTVSELLSNQFNAILDNYTKRLNVGLNYRASAFGSTNQQSLGSVQLALGYTFFDDRLEIAGNVGSVYNQWGGDANLSYKLTPDGRWLLRGFSRIDDRFTTDLAYRQGMGASYNREFDSYKELFKKQKSK